MVGGLNLRAGGSLNFLTPRRCLLLREIVFVQYLNTLSVRFNKLFIYLVINVNLTRSVPRSFSVNKL